MEANQFQISEIARTNNYLAIVQTNDVKYYKVHNLFTTH